MKFSQTLKPKTFSEIEPLVGKRVLLCFTADRCIVGKLGRNSFKNETLCINTGNGDELLYGNFFFELHNVESVKEILQ